MTVSKQHLTDAQEAVETATDLVEALQNGFVHYGETPPSNPNTVFWVSPNTSIDVPDVDVNYSTGLIELNGGKVFQTWVGTQNEYAALVEDGLIRDNCLYIVTDDTDAYTWIADLQSRMQHVETDLTDTMQLVSNHASTLTTVETNLVNLNDSVPKNTAQRIETVDYVVDRFFNTTTTTDRSVYLERVRWQSGACDIYARITFKNLNCAFKDYDGYYYADTQILDLTEHVKSIKTATMSGGSTSYIHIPIVHINKDGVRVQWYLAGLNAHSSVDGAVSITVHGTWK